MADAAAAPVAGPQVGEVAPLFVLPADDGSLVDLAALRGRPVILYFYPQDATPGCTTQSCDFRDNWAAIRDEGALVFGLSPDSMESHADFRRSLALPFPLLVDRDHRVAEAYGIWGEKRLFAVKYQGIKRTTIGIDGEGVVRLRLERARGTGHARAALEWLRSGGAGGRP